MLMYTRGPSSYSPGAHFTNDLKIILRLSCDILSIEVTTTLWQTYDSLKINLTGPLYGNLTLFAERMAVSIVTDAEVKERTSAARVQSDALWRQEIQLYILNYDLVEQFS